MGIAVAFLIFLWISDELSYDKFHTNLDNIYTVYEHQEFSNGQELYTNCTPFPLSKTLKNDYDEVVGATTFLDLGDLPIKKEKQHIIGPCLAADDDFLNIFSFNIIAGNKEALSSPDKIILTQEIADVFFPNGNAIGNTLTVNGEFECEVAAIIEKPVKNSTIDFKVILPVKFLMKIGWTEPDKWYNNWPRTSILLAEKTNTQTFDDKITNLCKDKGQSTTTFHIFPQKKEYLYSYSGKKNRVQYIYEFLSVALIIILIASINFLNFSTAISEQKKPEIGIRKALGASKTSLIKQFLVEKGIMIILSFVFGLFLVLTFFPLFSHLADKTFTIQVLQNKVLWLLTSGVLVITLILSVAYPAFHMSAFAPIHSLQSQHSRSNVKFSLKNGLIITQFVMSIGLIICSLCVSNQLHFISNYDLGYKKDNLVYLKLPGNSGEQHDQLSQEFEKISGVVSMTKTNKLPFYGGNSSWGYEWEGKDPDKEVLICQMRVDPNFFTTMNISFECGRTYSDIYEHWNDLQDQNKLEIVLNKTAIDRMGLDEPISKIVRNGNWEGNIVGVVNNFNFENLRNTVEPLLLVPLMENPRCIIFRIHPDNFYQTVNSLKEVWKEIEPDTPIQLGFFDEHLESMYTSEQKISGLFRSFTLIAILISCIGLFGLSLNTINNRTKEIGVRKVNGAHTFEIINMIIQYFLKWLLIAFIIATPTAWFAMNKWLENFAYRTTLKWWIFALSGFLAMGVALLTITWQSWKAATRNPVEALKYE